MTKVIRTRVETMTKELIERSRKRHALAELPLIVLDGGACVFAGGCVHRCVDRHRAGGHLVPFGGGGSGRLALAMLVGVIIAGMGGLTAALVHNDKFPPRRD